MTIDIRTTPIHLGLGGTAVGVPDFAWDPERLAAYAEHTRPDGPDGRLVMLFHNDGSPWEHWECHPLGDEVVVACTGRPVFRQDTPDGIETITLAPGEALINPTGVWHIGEGGEPGWILTITPGQGTEHKPR